MKLRIDPKKISFRLDLDELEQLLEQGEIEENTALPVGHIRYRVTRLPAGSPPKFQADPSGYHLSLARNILEDHKAALPSLKGIVCVFATEKSGQINVALEINLKKKLKHKLEL
ncbi:MAG: hypothetical protein JKY94_07105 [Rhodobacteraceae bacterium]|nr:hypothetical protein [Paracoccaceae bacterium]